MPSERQILMPQTTGKLRVFTKESGITQESKPGVEVPILVVDDDITFLSFMTAALTREGRPYVVAVTGAQALAVLANVKVRAVLLDRKLPDRDGVEVLREIVKNPEHPPVILISGAASVESAWEAGCLGAAGYLEKPLRMPEVMAVLDSVSDSKHRKVDPLKISSNTCHEPTSSSASMAATKRLAQVVLRASLQAVDFKNGRGFAKAVNIGYGTMRHWCYIAGVPGRAFVRFARGFWAIRHALRTGQSPVEILDCLEIESCRSILDPALPQGTTVEEYCVSQTLLRERRPRLVQAFARTADDLLINARQRESFDLMGAQRHATRTVRPHRRNTPPSAL